MVTMPGAATCCRLKTTAVTIFIGDVLTLVHGPVGPDDLPPALHPSGGFRRPLVHRKAGRAGRGAGVRARRCWTRRSSASHLRTRSASSRQGSASRTRSYSHGSSVMAKSRRPASGSRTCRSWYPRILSRVGDHGFISPAPDLTAGKNDHARFQASPMPWPHNGETFHARQNRPSTLSEPYRHPALRGGRGTLRGPAGRRQDHRRPDRDRAS